MLACMLVRLTCPGVLKSSSHGGSLQPPWAFRTGVSTLIDTKEQVDGIPATVEHSQERRFTASLTG